MPLFIVERRVAGMTMARLTAGQQAAVAAAAQLASKGIRVQYVRTMLMARESRCLCLFEAPDAETVRAINVKAGLPFDRIAEAADLTP